MTNSLQLALPSRLEDYLPLAARRESAGQSVAARQTLAALVEKGLRDGRFDLIEPAVAALATAGAEPRMLVVLANHLRVGGRSDLAIRLLESRLREKPDDIGALLTRAMASLAIVHASEDEIRARRAEYSHWLDRAAQAVKNAGAPERAAAADIVGAAKPFFLAYQGFVDREPQAKYGALVTQLIAASGLNARWRAPPAPEAKIRVGFVSFYFYTHSVLKMFMGWMRGLDRARFETHVFHLGATRDAMTEELAASVDGFHFGTRSPAAWIEAINQTAPHVVVYPEIGMDQTTLILAATRLAPVQCAAWGHPETTGLPTIDAFLTCGAMEPQGSEAHYTEDLVRLPGLSVCYAPLPSEGGRLKRSDYGLRPTDVVYICSQSLYKYLPRHDALFVDIARQIPRAHFLFLGPANNPFTLQFGRRIETAFRASGLDPRHHVTLAKTVPYALFPSWLRLGDIYLDSVGWSGFNTTLEAIGCDLPIVTWPEGPMRARHSEAVLRHMGLDDFIAGSAVDFVDLAVGLADPAKRVEAVARFKVARPRLYGDLAPVLALEDEIETRVVAYYRSGGAYMMPPSDHKWLSPRGIPSLDLAPTLRSKISL